MVQKTDNIRFHRGDFLRQLLRWGVTSVFFAVTLCCCTSCFVNPRVYMAETNPYRWASTQPVVLEYSNSDTTGSYHLGVVVRLNSTFTYNQLGLALTTITPDGFTWCDTLYVPSAIEQHDSGLAWEQKQHYRTGVQFRTPGRYLFTLRPVISSGEVKGVMAVGVSVEAE